MTALEVAFEYRHHPAVRPVARRLIARARADRFPFCDYCAEPDERCRCPARIARAGGMPP